MNDAMAGADRLSDLSDDLLASVVSFLPTREAVRTSVLSRRWRPVWLRAHSLVLDSRSYDGYLEEDTFGINDRFISDASNFLFTPSRCNHIKKLSLVVHGRKQEYFEHVMGGPSIYGDRRYDGYDLMASLLADAPLRSHLEQVLVKFLVIKKRDHDTLNGWAYKLDPAELPLHTLRVLDLEFCRLESPPDSAAAAVSFPRLSSLRLYKCSSSIKDLEGWIRTAPSLASVHIQQHSFYGQSEHNFHLNSPSITALTLVPESWSILHYELDVPRLRAFKYNGQLQGFSLKSQTTMLVRVDLTVQHEDRLTVQTWSAPLWQLLRRFRHVKTIRLKVPTIEGIAVDKAVQHEHLFTFQYLERLEVIGLLSDPASRRDDAALAIANLLHCCPVIHDLRIRILTDPYRSRYVGMGSTKAPVLSDFDVSMDVFNRRFSKEMVPLPLMLLDQDDDGCSQAAALPGLAGCRFRCLENHLKSVTLQFELKELNSFEVSLAKFFAENCMVLEALQIHDGKQTFLSHVNWMVERWRANAPKQMMESDSADSSKQNGKRKRNYRVCNAE